MGRETKLTHFVSETREPYGFEEEKRKREKKRKMKRKRRRREAKLQTRYGIMTFSMDLWNFKSLYG